jgi:hypothetical protein
MIVTFSDAVDYALTYLAKNADASPEAKRVVINAYRSIANKRDWNYYKRLLRLNTRAAQAIGTIQYVESTRVMTLTGATWPSWVTSGYVRLGQVIYFVASNPTSTTIVLDPATTPGADISVDTQYVLMQDAYPMPIDFRSIIGINWQAGTYNPAYVDFEEFIALSTLITGPAAPTYYTIYGDRNLLGTKDLRFYPAPDQAYQTNLYYNGAGRPLAIEYYRTGTAASIAGSTTVTGTGTSWTPSMVGSVIRLRASELDTNGDPIYPTGVDGLYPPDMEHIIKAVASPTSLALDSAAELSLSGAAYQISDPIDVCEGAMMNFFYRSIDWEARRLLRSKEISPEEAKAYNMSLMEALEADSVFAGSRVALAAQHRPRLMREYPITLNG